MGNLSNLFISQSFISVLHTGNDNTLSAQLVDIQDGLGNSSGVSLNRNGDLSMSGSLTASLQQGYVLVGNAVNKTSLVPTASFAGGGATWPVPGTPSGIVSGSSQLTASYDLRYALSGSGGGALPSGVVSGSSQITALGFVSSSITGSSLVTASFSGNTLTFTKGNGTTFGVVIPDVSGSTINTGSFATTGSNTFFGQETFNGNLVINESGSAFGDALLITSGRLRVDEIGNYSGNLNINGGGAGADFNLNGYNTSIKLGAYTPISITGDTEITGALDLTGNLTASLQEGYVWVGDSSGRTTTVATSSFGGGGTIPTGSFATTGSNTFIGNQTITGSLYLSSSVSSSFIVPNTFGVDGFVVDGNMKVQNGTLIVPQAINAGGIYLQTIGRNSNDPINVDNGLNIRPGAPGIEATNVSISGSLILSQSLQVGANSLFLGNQQITGSLSVSSSTDRIVFNGPNISNFSPGTEGGVVVKNSFSVMGDTRLEGAVRFTGQLDVNKIVKGQGGSIPELAIVSDTLIYNDSGIGGGKNLGVSGSVFVSQSLQVGGDLNAGNNLIVSGNQQFNVGTFLSNVSQSGSANVSQSMNFETTDISDGVYIGITPSQIYCTNRGTYNIQFSAQIVAAGGADDIYIWLKKNGTNVPATAGHIQLGNNEELIAAWNYVVDSVPNDYFEIVWQATNASTILLSEAASGNIPSVPSVILTVTQVR
jgi:hypothetical protein